MAVEVPMPRLSDTMEQGTIARWVKHEGDSVAAGDVIAEIDTDKATMDLTAYEDGVLLKILVGAGRELAAADGVPERCVHGRRLARVAGGRWRGRGREGLNGHVGQHRLRATSWELPAPSRRRC